MTSALPPTTPPPSPPRGARDALPVSLRRPSRAPPSESPAMTASTFNALAAARLATGPIPRPRRRLYAALRAGRAPGVPPPDRRPTGPLRAGLASCGRTRSEQYRRGNGRRQARRHSIYRGGSQGSAVVYAAADCAPDRHLPVRLDGRRQAEDPGARAPRIGLRLERVAQLRDGDSGFAVAASGFLDYNHTRENRGASEFRFSLRSAV